MIFRRKIPALARCMLIFLAMVVLATEATIAEGLFPSMNQLFGTSMPSIGVALDRSANETVDTERGKEETYHSFTYDDYTVFGAYLAGAGARIENFEVTDSTITITLSVRGASMEFSYDWNNQTSTAVYPSGTRPETEKEVMATKANILPPVGGIMPSAQFAVNRKPDSENATDYGITQSWTNFTDDEYNAFSVYLAETGATLKQSSSESGILNAEISLNSCSFTFTYDWRQKIAIVSYPNGTTPEREKWNTLNCSGSILPELNTIGKDLPNMSKAICRLPDTVETCSDGSNIETYKNFNDVDYDAFSQYLLMSDCTIDDYHVDDGSVIVVSLSNLTGTFTFSYDALRHIGTVTYPKGSRIETAWSKPTAAPDPIATPRPPQPKYSEDSCWRTAKDYFLNSIRWNDPDSVTIFSHSSYFDDLNSTYTFVIDYSAKVVAGGKMRRNFYINVNANTNSVTSAFGEN